MHELKVLPYVLMSVQALFAKDESVWSVLNLIDSMHGFALGATAYALNIKRFLWTRNFIIAFVSSVFAFFRLVCTSSGLDHT